jgi:hypothetical protein
MVNPTQRLRVLKSEIETAQRNAAAERALAATGAESNPWAGSAQKCDELHKEKRELELEIEGEAVKARLERLRTLDKGLAAAMEARTSADEAQRVASEHEAVGRWMKAGSIARALGCAYDLEAQFAPWYLSNRERYAGAPACVDYFMKSTNPGLRFTEQDRPHIIRWHLAKGAAQAAIIHWSALAESRALLLREHPELAAAA